MSLRSFHIFFIFCAIFLVGWLALMNIGTFGHSRSLSALLVGIVFLTGAAGLAVYLLWFLRKNKKTGK